MMIMNTIVIESVIVLMFLVLHFAICLSHFTFCFIIMFRLMHMVAYDDTHAYAYDCAYDRAYAYAYAYDYCLPAFQLACLPACLSVRLIT